MLLKLGCAFEQLADVNTGDTGVVDRSTTSLTMCTFCGKCTPGAKKHCTGQYAILGAWGHVPIGSKSLEQAIVKCRAECEAITGHAPKGIKPCIGYIFNEDKGECFLKTELTEMRNSGNVKAYAEFVSEKCSAVQAMYDIHVKDEL